MKKKAVVTAIAISSIFTSGCAVVQLPFRAVGATFGLLGETVKLIQKLPMPPPWVFF